MDQVWILQNRMNPSFAFYSRTVKYEIDRPNNTFFKINAPKQHVPIIWTFKNVKSARSFSQHLIHEQELLKFDVDGTKCHFKFKKNLEPWNFSDQISDMYVPIDVMNDQTIQFEDHLVNLVVSTQCQFCVVYHVSNRENILEIDGGLIRPYDTIYERVDESVNETILELLEQNLSF